MSTPNLWEFCKNGYFLDVRRIYFRKKGLSSWQFSRKNMSQSNFQRRCMGSWEVERTYFPHTIFSFYFFIFLFMKYCIDRYAIILVPHNSSLLSLTCLQRHTVTIIPSIVSPSPTPSLPHDSDHAECERVSVYPVSTPLTVFLYPYEKRYARFTTFRVRIFICGPIGRKWMSNYLKNRSLDLIPTLYNHCTPERGPLKKFLGTYDEPIGRFLR